jgi:hypothetical protein
VFISSPSEFSLISVAHVEGAPYCKRFRSLYILSSSQDCSFQNYLGSCSLLVIEVN